MGLAVTEVCPGR